MNARFYSHVRLALGAALLAGLGACVAGGGFAAGGGGTAVYGDFGYVEPWAYPGTWYDERGNYAHPPYQHFDEHEREQRAPAQVHRDGVPARAARPPTIPNIPRPPHAPRPPSAPHADHRQERH